MIFSKTIKPFQSLGVSSREATPVPFPNTAVKLSRADGSALARE